MKVSDRSRRQFLRNGTYALGGLLGSGLRSAAPLDAQEIDPVVLPTYVADTNGDLQLDAADEELVRQVLFSQRGYDLRPLPGFDHRADVFGRGVIDPVAVESVRHTIDTVAQAGSPIRRRPVTVAWHYGWYNLLKRPPGTQTVGYKGGDYFSWDPEVEALFNEQKNEFGISVDALSWIPPRANQNAVDNFQKGFLNAPNLQTRHAALLYESTLALPTTGNRINFLDQAVQVLLRQDFGAMARFWVELRDQSKARIFVLDRRPVVFIFGSHSWGVLPLTQAETTAFEISMDHAREAFRVVYGQVPYIIGEEMVLSSKGTFAEDRVLRTKSFDGIYSYHHASNLKPTHLSGVDATLFVTDDYTENQLALLRTTYDAVRELRNRYTGKRVLVIPNIAPGFAKPGLPTLMIDRAGYANFMKLVQQFHVSSYIEVEWLSALGTPELPAPVYIVGSWNEEFEGHAVFPSRFNESLSSMEQQGYDLAMAIKEAFGWNHYAERPILP